jgi:hypothetical protein
MPNPELIAIPAIPSELSRFPGHDPSIRHLVLSAGLDDSGQLPGLFFCCSHKAGGFAYSPRSFRISRARIRRQLMQLRIALNSLFDHFLPFMEPQFVV